MDTRCTGKLLEFGRGLTGWRQPPHLTSHEQCGGVHCRTLALGGAWRSVAAWGLSRGCRGRRGGGRGATGRRQCHRAPSPPSPGLGQPWRSAACPGVSSRAQRAQARSTRQKRRSQRATQLPPAVGYKDCPPAGCRSASSPPSPALPYPVRNTLARLSAHDLAVLVAYSPVGSRTPPHGTPP